jgi:hypothetical protein
MSFQFSSPNNLFRLLLAAVIAAGTLLTAQMSPDAPIEDFRFPMFNDEGFKIWEVRGVQGIYIDHQTSQIIGLDLQVFTGDDEMLLTHQILSPSALIHFDRRSAAGDSSIFVTGPGFNLEGEDWSYEGSDDRITIRRKARMTLNQEINILR